MTDPIPQNIFAAIKAWVSEKKPCKIEMHVNGEGQIVLADRVVKDRVAAQ